MPDYESERARNDAELAEDQKNRESREAVREATKAFLARNRPADPSNAIKEAAEALVTRINRIESKLDTILKILARSD